MKPLKENLRICFFFFLFIISFVQAQNKDFVLVIDPGHGGTDNGAEGTYGNEKDFTLSMALKLGALIKKHNKDVKVIYTRQTDKFIPLKERADIANNNKADLFISIHCNSASNRGAYGTETFVLGVHRNKDNLDVEKRENNVIFLEDNYQTTYKNYNSSSPELQIAIKLLQDAHLQNSLLIAQFVEENFVKDNRLSRGVKQAGFLVLVQTAMPAILIETGFVSNSEECYFLSTEKGQKQIVSDIYKAFVSYKNIYDKKSEIKVDTLNNEMDIEKALRGNSRNNTPITINPSSNQGSAIINNQTNQINSSSNTNNINADKVSFLQIQFLSSDIKYPKNALQFKGLKNIEIIKEGDRYNYYFGKERTLETAQKKLDQIRKIGFKNATIETIYPNKRLASDEFYTLELLSSTRPLTNRELRIKKLTNASVKKSGRIYYYSMGKVSTYSEIIKLQDRLKKLGLHDAIISKQKITETR